MTDKPEDKQLDIQESLKTSEKTSGESTIGSTSRQNDWGRVNEISHQNDQHPSEVEGVKAIDSFGIDFGNGSVMTAKGVVEGKCAPETKSKEEGSRISEDSENTSPYSVNALERQGADALAAAQSMQPQQEGFVRVGDQQYPAEALTASKDGKVGSARLSRLRTDIQNNIKMIRESNAPSGNKLVGIAMQLGRDPVRWRSKTTGKCNQLVGESIKQCFGKTPWEGPAPTCHGLNRILNRSNEWEQVWNAGDRDFTTALKDFQEYKPHQGDIVIWDNKHETHSGIIDEDKFLYYAGSRESDTGYAKSHIEYYCGTPKSPRSFGAPTVIYRHKQAAQWTK